VSAVVDKKDTVKGYSDGFQHLEDELGKLDLILRRNIIEFRARFEVANHNTANKHLFISHEEVDLLLQAGTSAELPQQQINDLDMEISRRDHEISEALSQGDAQGIIFPLLRLSRLFNLSQFEVQVLIIALAPELRHKYDRIYAYLQDDITRKRPSIDLVLQLLCPTETDRWHFQGMLTSNGVLLQAGLLQLIEDPHSPSGSSGLAQFVKLDSGILNYILGDRSVDRRLNGIVRLASSVETAEPLVVDPDIECKLSDIIDWRFKPASASPSNLVLHLHGPLGVGKKALALSQCRRLKCNLLCLDTDRLTGAEDEIANTLKLTFRESLLLQAPLYIHSIDGLTGNNSHGPLILKVISELIQDYGWLTFLAGESPWHPDELFDNCLFRSLSIPMPDFTLRKQAWMSNLASWGAKMDDAIAVQLASQFQLTSSQISSAVETVSMDNSLKGVGRDISCIDLMRACRNQSNQRLHNLAVKVEALYGWDNLVLPDRASLLLRQICDQIRQQYKVFNLWGFDTKLSYGKGLSALFTGPPGTGKTMAAQVVANEMQLDLYKVDLSTVISKYIGETEKNLSQIFNEAETSNAILFFDEADALFGKRTEVNDAHDRYANIEVSYLLQKMEEYNGIVILASNFRGNMDDAFVRRIRFIIEFPFPGETSRERIWKIHFPDQAPVADDIDYELLARQFSIAGGNIKNIILNAAFHAAKQDEPIAMAHILEGARHEYEKIGKLWSDGSISKTTPSRKRG